MAEIVCAHAFLEGNGLAKEGFSMKSVSYTTKLDRLSPEYQARTRINC